MLFFVVDVGCLFVVLWFWFCFWRGLGEIGINILEVNLTTYSGEKSKANGIGECGWIMGRVAGKVVTLFRVTKRESNRRHF